METKTKIENLAETLKAANTATDQGRQQVADACKELYNLIEKDVFDSGCEWMLKGMYAALCAGNFAEPFMCEQKKNVFLNVKAVFEDRILL